MEISEESFLNWMGEACPNWSGWGQQAVWKDGARAAYRYLSESVKESQRKEFGQEDTKALHLTVCQMIEQHIKLGKMRDLLTEEDYPVIEGRNELADRITDTAAAMYCKMQEEIQDVRDCLQSEILGYRRIYGLVKEERDSLQSQLSAKEIEAQEYRNMLKRVMDHPDDYVAPAIKTIISFLLFQHPKSK